MSFRQSSGTALGAFLPPIGVAMAENNERKRPQLVLRVVVAGGWSLEAAEAVCSGDGIRQNFVLDLLGGLVDKSLVMVGSTANGTTRYRMLEPIRQYGQERLQESGESEAIQSRHAASFLALAKQAGPELSGSQQVMWLKRLDTERDNLRAAMRWLLGKGESETAARIGWAVWLFWWMHGYFTEGRRWMEEALAKKVKNPRRKADEELDDDTTLLEHLVELTDGRHFRHD